MHRVGSTMMCTAALGLLCACTAPEPPPVKDVPIPVDEPPVDAPPPEPPPPEPPPKPPTLADIVADVALVNDGQLMCSDGSQCLGRASWANCDYGTPKVATNDAVHVITHDGVEEMILKVDGYSARVKSTSKGEPTGADQLMMLALRNTRPSASARLEERQLDPNVSAAEAKLVRTWLEQAKPAGVDPSSLKPIGAIDGKFGDGVNRIVVLAPKRKRPVPEGDVEPRPDVAVLLADGLPRGLLPFGDVEGLIVAKVVDLDGDGTQELVWISQPTPFFTLVTHVSISYFDGSEFVEHVLGGCSYVGCNEFVPIDKCGHALVKRHPRD